MFLVGGPPTYLLAGPTTLSLAGGPVALPGRGFRQTGTSLARGLSLCWLHTFSSGGGGPFLLICWLMRPNSGRGAST